MLLLDVIISIKTFRKRKKNLKLKQKLQDVGKRRKLPNLKGRWNPKNVNHANKSRS